jgi:hypothetical protein
MSHDVHPPCAACGDPDYAQIECQSTRPGGCWEGVEFCEHCGDPPQWDSDKLACSCTIYEVNNR